MLKDYFCSLSAKLMVLVRILLFPFSILYDLVTRLRNRLFDLGLKPSVSFDLPVICIGNLSVGGTGKTLVTEHLIRLLSGTHRIATLSRGYGRSTKGIRIAVAGDTALTIGDEPYQLYKKFGEKITIAVGEERALAIPYLVDQFPDTNVILLDDAFQHRSVRPGFSILLTDYARPFYNDFLLPSGRLRESGKGAKRADCIVVTKCPPHLDEEEMMLMEASIRKLTDKPVFFSSLRYGEPRSFSGKELLDNKRVILVSGIANHVPLEEYVEANFTLMKHLIYRDHHNYSNRDVQSIRQMALHQQAVVLTTEKDQVKLQALLEESDMNQFFVLPIEPDFMKSGANFDAMVLDYVNRAVEQ
jgi:tetraacyldisaccharide 4'-kinase